MFWVRGLAQKSAEVSDLTDGQITYARDVGNCFTFAQDVCVLGCLPCIIVRFNFGNMSRGGRMMRLLAGNMIVLGERLH